jgi:hypothetical protein
VTFTKERERREILRHMEEDFREAMHLDDKCSLADGTDFCAITPHEIVYALSFVM